MMMRRFSWSRGLPRRLNLVINLPGMDQEGEFQMMTLPFFVSAIAVYLAWRGKGTAAVGVTLLAVLTVFVLYRFHATDALNLDF